MNLPPRSHQTQGSVSAQKKKMQAVFVTREALITVTIRRKEPEGEKTFTDCGVATKET